MSTSHWLPAVSLAAAIGCCSASAVAQDANTNPFSSDELIRSVVLLLGPTETPPRPSVAGAQPAHQGTGFLLHDARSLFLVTAAHVAAKLGPGSTLIIPGDDGLAQAYSLTGLTGNSDLSWIIHPRADVAVLLLPSGSTLTAPISPRSLDISILVTTLSAPPRERPVLVCGFPLGLGFTATQKGAYLSALSRESKPASGLVTLVLPGAESPAVLFLLADPSIQGYSGAPVYLPAGAVVAGSAIGFAFEKSCVGIVSGTISDDTGGKLAAIVPSAFVFEAVELARTKLRRQFHLF